MAAMAHLASGSGRRTFFPGLRIFAVSPMKETPQKTIISASVAAAFFERPSESPTKSARSWTSGRV